MYSFMNDYSETAHPRVLQAIVDAAGRQFPGYGLDPVSQEAAGLVRDRFSAPKADVHFVVGGTQANALVIAAALRPYEAAVAAATGHINVHETGAVEAAGHKVCTVPAPDGKLTPALVAQVADGHASEHMVLPRLVYVSDTTEVGTVYTKAELTALHDFCAERGLYLYLDGARLGAALTAKDNDLTPADIAALTDAFYLGGTKNGALFGEAIVITNDALKSHFRWNMKQRGAILAKGFLSGLQFRELLRDGLYLDLARHANEMAAALSAGIAEKGYSFTYPPQSNQIFVTLPNNVAAGLEAMGYGFEADHAVDEAHTCVRLVTSWATPWQAVDQFLRDLPPLLTGQS